MARSLSATPSAASAPHSPGLRLRGLAVPALSLLTLVALWQFAAMIAGDPRLMPSPSRVLAKILADSADGELPWNLAITLMRVTISFVIAMTTGVAIGIVMGRVRLADELGQPWLVFFLNLPALVTIILCYIWIGLIEAAALLAVAACASTNERVGRARTPSLSIALRRPVKSKRRPWTDRTSNAAWRRRAGPARLNGRGAAIKRQGRRQSPTQCRRCATRPARHARVSRPTPAAVVRNPRAERFDRQT